RHRQEGEDHPQRRFGHAAEGTLWQLIGGHWQHRQGFRSLCPLDRLTRDGATHKWRVIHQLHVLSEGLKMIRILVVYFVSLVSLSSFAFESGLDERTPWGEIFARNDLNLVAPTTALSHAYGSLRVSALNVCRRGTKIELLAGDIKVCTREMPTRGGRVCVS